MYKKILKIFLYLVIIFVLFSITDFFVSKHTNLFHVKKDCFKYIKINHNNKKYYSYELDKNCFAFEHKGTTPAYNVKTNENGFRIGKKFKPKNEKKILFLGDSFSYGFGVNYEDSIAGLIEKKTNYKFEIVNFAAPGYSPSMNLYKLKKYLDKNKDLKIEKVFYILDLTDVHDESNRWSNIKEISKPVIIDNTIEKEIEKTFKLKKHFRTLRFLSYLINKNIRNLRKKIKKLFSNIETNEIDEKGTYWGAFTHTPYSKIKKDNKNFWSQDINIGIKNIKLKLKEISDLIKPYETEFYIVIHPWRETLELGQNEFDWEMFSNDICVLTNCDKLISFFDDVRNLKNKNPNWKSEIYFKKDIHFNKKGNEMYSNLIFNEAFK